MTPRMREVGKVVPYSGARRKQQPEDELAIIVAEGVQPALVAQGLQPVVENSFRRVDAGRRRVMLNVLLTR